MATDSTELTFVRCPSCRSLVPAVSTRCRMCGAGLEEDELASGAEEDDFSTPESALESAPAEAEDDFDDPLGAYLEDFEDEEDEELAASEPIREESDYPEAIQEEEEEDLVEEMDSDIFEAGDEAGFLEEDFDDVVDDDEAPLVTQAPRQPRVEESTESVAPRVRMERGSSKKGLSFGGRAKQKTPDESSHEAEATFEGEASRMWREQRRQGRRREESAPSRNQDGAMGEQGVSARGAVAAQQAQDNQGLLHGWLVSFSVANGVGYELREGKFFVSRTPLKDKDFVLDHPSVSTPHALMTLSDEYGLLVQDLMSETGVFVRREGDAIYRKEEEAIILGHGDWVRFGEQEFLVTLIPSLPRG